MSGMAVQLGGWNSYRTNSVPPCLSNIVAEFHCWWCASMKSPKRCCRSHCNLVRIDEFTIAKNAAPAFRAVGRTLASSLHNSGGSVDRNDAASTGPLIWPTPQILLEEAVRSQMDALTCNDEPRPDHGLEVMYYFANTERTDNGGSLPSYFGFPSDLYHFGHFALKFKTRYPELINHSGYEVLQLEEAKEAGEGHCARVMVQVSRGHEESSTWIFTMSKHSRGNQLPCWLTTSLQRYSNSQESSTAEL